MQEERPREFDGYRLVRLLGRGAMGEVFLAHDTVLDRPVAIKFISAAGADEQTRRRFFVEARAIARLQHPNVVSIYRVGEAGGAPYLVSEFVRGTSLDQLETPVPWRQALRIGLDIARALAAAHQRGVVHRDIKPANAILSSDGEVKLLDFGIAKLLEPLASATSSLVPRTAEATRPVEIGAETAQVVARLSARPPDTGRFDAAFGSVVEAIGLHDESVPNGTPGSTDALDAHRTAARQVDPARPDPRFELLGERRSDPSEETAAVVVRRPRSVPVLAPAQSSLADTGMFAAAFGASAQPSAANASTTEDSSSDARRDEQARQQTLAAPERLPVAALREARSVDLTIPGTLMGTPLYMAPEVWCAEPATFESDIYSLGALLYKLCAGHAPHVGARLAQLAPMVTQIDARPLAEVATDVDRAFAAVVDRCLRRDPAARYPNGNALRAALVQLTPEARREVVPEGNPYRGLSAFEASHSALYFGRDSEIRATLERLSTEAFVLVAGDSGVGKSSLCRAGVLPRLSDWLDRRRTWSVVSFVPGKHPVAALAAALAPYLGLAEAELERRMLDEAAALGRELRRGQGEARGVVLFIDQLEELVTLGEPREAALVAEVLGWLTSPAPGVRVLATVRGDFLSRLAALPPIGDVLSRALYFLRPLSAERVREAIVGPADASGVRFESPALVDALVDETVHAGGGLPLLQFALAQLWEARDRERQIITATAYEQVGGVAGALTRHADDVMQRMLPAERDAARPLFLRLVTAEGTRARRSEAELTRGDPTAVAALEAIVRGRLVVAREGRDELEGSVFEIAHEALVRGWKTLARWLSLDENRRLALERISTAAREWRRVGHAPDALFGRRQLAEVEAIAPSELAAEERAFVEASRGAWLRARIVRIGGWVALPIVLLVIGGAVQLKAAAELRRRVDVELDGARRSFAEARLIRAEVDGLEAKSYALFDAREREGAEKVWANARKRTAELQSLLGHATQQLEGALVLDRGRADVQAELADVLFDRALLAEARSATAERDELLQRMFLYDARGERRHRWTAPATVSLVTEPRGAKVFCERYVGDGARLRLEPVSFARGSDDVHLAPGSYRLTLATDGPPTLYPFEVSRAETLRISVDLQPAAGVPKGFVYVPAGRFFFGSTAEDSLRRGFFHAVPVHRAKTGGYYIAAQETTFADWIEFLRALPANERAARLPHLDQGGFSGAIAFKELPNEGYQLTFQPATQSYTARPGEKVSYVGRTRRASQDWLKFPVFAVGIDDARAYAGWLASSGRVPGARLCGEQEWERAARGGDRREYPHGPTLEVDDANFDETYGKIPSAMGPDEIGSHPASSSPFGLQDMSGNVWEWTESAVTKGGVAARGGSYYFDVNTARVSHREEPEPSFRDASVGFRVCADLRPR